MEYQLENAIFDDLNLLIKYKLSTIFEYAKDLEQEEITNIHNYVNSQISKQLDGYKIIKLDNKIIGCLLVLEHLDGVILNEIFIEEEYRNKGIGTKILRNILSNNSIVYLWVYKNNIKAIKLYEKFGFNIIENTETRYFMKYSKLQNARNFCKDVKELSKKYNLPFFVVTDGASATSNNGCEAVKNARDNHIKWELEHNFDPEEDWSEKN